MGTKLSPRDNELYQRVDEVLHYAWDPIGVSWEPNARDEYQGYLPHVFSLLKHSADEETLTKYLASVTTEQMGLRGNIERDRRIAALVISWRDAILEKYEGQA